MLGRRRGATGPDDSPSAGSTAVDVRVSGFWRWRTVLVPPNAFVVHTRRGHEAPLHVGLGVSFRFNPATDSFLVAPGAMQTILINAYCICQELQGVVVQAYVQWIIQDFAVAYRKLDFSDADDPMRLVNLQLKEQAEAAIKDKVATMSVHEVLSDKQLIVEELTARLRGVAEGEGSSDRGLGLRIVTVQIKEAVVSSTTLWKNLQKPFRSEQERIARLAELASDEAITEREMESRRAQETFRMASESELSELRSRNEATTFDREAAESIRRTQREREDARLVAELASQAALHDLALEKARNEEETEVGRLRLEREQLLRRLEVEGGLALARAKAQAEHERDLLHVERERLRGAIANDRSTESIQAELVRALPEIVTHLPTPTELRSVTVGGPDTGSLAGILTQLIEVVSALRNSGRG